MRRMRVLLVTLATAGLLGAATPASLAAPGGNSGCQVRVGGTTYTTLQSAVDGASVGDRLKVTGSCIGLTTIDKDLTIAGANGAILDGAFAGPVLTIAAAGTDVDTSVLINNLTVTRGSTGISVGGRKVTATLKDVDVTGNQFGAGVGLSGTLVLDGHTSVTGNAGTGIHGFILARIILNGHSSVDHNGGPGIDGTDNQTVVLNDHSSIHHNAGSGVSLEGFAVILNDHSSIHHNAGSGVFSGDEGDEATCNDHSTIHHNSYGIRSFFDYYGPSSTTHCVAGDNVYDNTVADILVGG